MMVCKICRSAYALCALRSVRCTSCEFSVKARNVSDGSAEAFRGFGELEISDVRAAQRYFSCEALSFALSCALEYTSVNLYLLVCTWRAREGGAHLSEKGRADAQQTDCGARCGGGCRGPQRYVLRQLPDVRDAAYRADELYWSLPS
jgi:hypothetical protein